MPTFAPKEDRLQKLAPDNPITHDLTTTGAAHRGHSVLRLQRVIGNQAVGRLLQRQVAAPAITESQAGGARAKPDWLAADHGEPLPGVPAPGYEAPKFQRPWMPVRIPPWQDAHIYTETDREKLLEALAARELENRQNVARFLNDFVTAAVQISGEYASAEMSAVGKAAGQGMFVKLLKFALSESAEALLAGGVGVFAWKLGKGTISALEFLAKKGTGFTANEVTSADEDALLSAALDKRQATLDRITSEIGKSTGQFVEEMVLGMGGEEVNRSFWLGRAKLHDLWRFRIAEAFPPAKREGIRAVVAGIVASHAHTGKVRTRLESWGLQPGPDTFDRHEVVVHLTPAGRGAMVRLAQLNTSSAILSRELTGASIRMLPGMALFIMIDRADALDEPAIELMDAFRSPMRAEVDEIADFVEAYSAARTLQPQTSETDLSFLKGTDLYGKALVKRSTDGIISASSMGLREELWLYRWATGDDNLGRLASELIAWQQEEQQSDEPRMSGLASPSGLARLTHYRLAHFRVEGARKLISDFVGDLVPQPATGEWTKGRPMNRLEGESISPPSPPTR